MRVQALYTYPIKSLRGVSLPSSSLTHHGLPYDRRFCLVQDLGETATQRYKPMFIAKIPRMALFTTELIMPDAETGDDGAIVVSGTVSWMSALSGRMYM